MKSSEAMILAVMNAIFAIQFNSIQFNSMDRFRYIKIQSETKDIISRSRGSEE